MKLNSSAKSQLKWSLIYFLTPLVLLLVALVADNIVNNGMAYSEVNTLIQTDILLGIYIIFAIAVIVIKTLKAN